MGSSQLSLRKYTSPPLRLSQEAAWLQFNRRVLLQTERPDFPVLERLRFLAIWAANLDEFFSARVSRAFLQERGSEGYKALLAEAKSQADFAEDLYQRFLQELEPLGVRVLPPNKLSKAELRYFGAYLAEEVAPKTDLIQLEGLADLSSRALYFASGEGLLQNLIRLPESIPRLLPIPGREGSFVRLGELLRQRSDLFLPHRGKLYELRVIRLASLERSRVDWDELPEALEARLDGKVSHLEVEQDFPPHWAEAIRMALGLDGEEVFRLSPPLDLRFVSTLVAAGPAKERFAPQPPEKPRRFVKNPWSTLDEQDLLLHHPYQDYHAVEAFALAAAKDPKVEAMRATLYRLGRENGVAEALIWAAKAGKDVAVLLEARARFDELLNLYWSLRFSRAGVRVLPLPSKKVHAKALWVQRGRQAYAHLGTGNYNALNGSLYTDLSLFTADPKVTKEVAAFFQALEARQAPTPTLIKTGPAIREALLEAIQGEAHKKGQIILKFNHLTDPTILAALEAAAEKGARVDLIVRSTLTLLHPEFHARSLVGRYLEHARVAAFKNKGKWTVWAGSTDLMPRNLDRRYELFFPVLDPQAKRQVLRLLKSQLKDDVNTFVLKEDGSQKALWKGKHDAQRF
ncbi:MAG TPA: polyphosphate kinase [Meiothermus sp.]|nr:polyphosphate kinase [Meiothermus sp.]